MLMINIKHKNCSIQISNCKKSDLKSNIFLKFTSLFILLLVCFSYVSRTQTNKMLTHNELTIMTFKEKQYDFGNIPSGKSVSTLFKFLNTGKNSLLVKEVTTSCGCTVSEWPKEIIEPNESGEIKIVYDAKYPGRFNKTITVVVKTQL